MAKQFVRTERQAKEMKGQAALVLEALDTADGPKTVEQLTSTIKDLGLVTRQAPERITSYYLCIFKKQGLVRVVETEPEASPAEVDEVEEVAAE